MLGRLFVLALALCLAGCFEDSGKHAGEEAAKQVRAGAEKLGDDIKKGMADVAKLDVTGIRTVLEKNESLQDYVQRLKTEIEQLKKVNGRVRLDSASDELIFRFTEVKGRFWIEAWVDDRARNKWIERDLIGSTLDEQVQQIRYQYQVDPALNQMIALVKGGYAPEASVVKKDYPIDFRIGNAGLHEIHMAITPVKAKDKAQWLLRYEVVLRRGNKDRPITSGLISSDDKKISWSYDEEFNRLLAVLDVALP